MNKLKLMGLAALLALGGCMTKGQIKKIEAAEQKKCDGQVEFNTKVAQSLIAQDCNNYINDLVRQWEFLFCDHDKSLADKLAKATGEKAKYFKPCPDILKSTEFKRK